MSCGNTRQRREDSEALFAEYARTGDGAVREELVLRHLELVASLAHHLRKSKRYLDDLLQVGYLGLIKAIDRFTAGHGTCFTAYATPTILGEMRRYLRDKAHVIRLPREVQENLQRLRRATDGLTQTLGREPTTEELARESGLAAREVEALLPYVNLAVLSLERHAYGADDEQAPAILAHLGHEDREIELAAERYDLKRALAELTPRERAIMLMYFFEERSQAEIGEQLRISQMHVSRLQRGALRRLKSDLNGHSGSERDGKR